MKLAIIPLLVSTALHAQKPYEAVPGGFVSGEVRIRLLSPTLLRLEYAHARAFADSPSAVVLKRDWNPPEVSLRADSGWIVLSSKGMTLRYRAGGGPLTRENLSLHWNAGSKEGTWAPGDSDRENLGGISSSLDGARKGRLPKQLPGILSRSGYFLLDDSRTPLWDGASQWIAARGDSGSQDLYFFAYGRDYKHVLKEYALLCGPVPMIPKYVLGTWATDLNYEYLPGTDVVDNYRYTDDSVRSIISRFRTFGIPLDVMVLDYAWHLRGWHGSYDWSPIFPHPDEFLGWARSEGVKVTLNDHPGYGRELVLSNEDSRSAGVRKELNIPPPQEPTLTISLMNDWRFRTDPSVEGDRGAWSSTAFDDSRWMSINADRPWEDRGFPDYDGVGWYRKWVAIPADIRAQHLFAVFGSVDDEYDIFVNGRKAAHHSPSWNALTSTDILPFVKKGEKNLIVLRVNDWGGEGGLSGPTAMITDVIRQEGMRFNLAEKRQADVFMNVLHRPLIEKGISFWWVDGGSGSCELEGLNSQMWTNRVFYDYTARETGKRSFIFSRYGGWGSHRYPSLFTGDTYAQWDVLAFEVPYTVQGGNILMPYITHDIGGFIGRNISLDLYTRWLQFGVFSPLLRLHSAHENPREGNARMPWTYGDRGVTIARDLFRLRYRLLPYIYTMTRAVHDDAVPLLRPLYLVHPDLEEAYRHPDEYYFGDGMLVAPITDSSGERSVYLPPGEWVDYFTGAKYRGPATMKEKCSLETFPLYVRSGSIIPCQPDMEYTDQRPLDSLLVDVYASGNSWFSLYEDDGLSLDFAGGKSARTPIGCVAAASGCRLAIGPTEGEYAGQPARRSYRIRVSGIAQPRSVTLDGKLLGKSGAGRWEWDGSTRRLIVTIERQDIRRQVSLLVR
ncbi:MAG TPA: TIM-barrel domain-containing protein [Bacteroidota bacterium]|nr:TIM-barrel domain-containing protein [Bacteroidota bacterium]